MTIIIICPADLKFSYGHRTLERTNNKRYQICRCLRDSNPGPFVEQEKAGSRGSCPALGGTSNNNKIVCLNMVKIKAQLIRQRV